MRDKEFRKGLTDLFYGGFVAAVVGIALIPLYKGYAVLILVAGLITIISSAFLMIKEKQRGE